LHAILADFVLAIVVLSVASMAAGRNESTGGVREVHTTRDSSEINIGFGSARVFGEDCQPDVAIFRTRGADVIGSSLIQAAATVLLLDFILSALGVLFELEVIVTLHVLALVFKVGIDECVEAHDVLAVAGLAATGNIIVAVGAKTVDSDAVLVLAVLRVLPLLAGLASDELEGVVLEEGELVLFFLLRISVLETTRLSHEAGDGLAITEGADGGGVNVSHGDKESNSERQLHRDGSILYDKKS
jgi:hypothetical protein